MDSERPILEEQRRYYRERTPEYDDWWERRGRYDKGSAFKQAWLDDVDSVRRSLAAFGPTGNVLEIAGGTGNWTAELARHGGDLTVIEQSPESIAVNRAKLANLGASPNYIEVDAFAYEPSETFDVVFFSFWQSHVPESHFVPFWQMVRRSLRPDGRVFLIDNAHPSVSETMHNAPIDVHTRAVTPSEDPVDLLAGTAVRSLADGREFEIVKHYWRPKEYEQLMASLGWRMVADETEHFFFMAEGQPV